MVWPALLEMADRATLSAFGDSTITYSPSAGSPVTVSGIFDATYVIVETGHADVASSGPAVFLRLSDLPSDPEQDTPIITISDADYSVREVKKDGQGSVLLLLHMV
jgi:hypothetical protein